MEFVTASSINLLLRRLFKRDEMALGRLDWALSDAKWSLHGGRQYILKCQMLGTDPRTFLSSL